MRGFELKPGKVTPESIGAVPLHTLDGDKTIYVAKSGSDETGDGSGAKPFASIQKAVDTIAPGVWVGDGSMRLRISAGIYDEDVLIEGAVHNSRPLSVICENSVEIRSLSIYGCETVVFSGNLTIRQSDNLKPGINIGDSTVQLSNVNVIKPPSDNTIQATHVALYIWRSIVTYINGSLQGGGIGLNNIQALTLITDSQIAESAIGIDVYAGVVWKSQVSNTATTKESKRTGGQIFE